MALLRPIFLQKGDKKGGVKGGHREMLKGGQKGVKKLYFLQCTDIQKVKKWLFWQKKPFK